MMPSWTPVPKSDQRCRVLADRHYTRQTPGHHAWTRPGYNFPLYLEQRSGRSAVFCWWRPKWEAGIHRKDRLECIECTIFRNETRYRSSDLIRDATTMLVLWERYLDVALPDGLVTGVGDAQTAGGRHPDHPPGWCFYKAGWVYFDHPGKGVRANTWLRLDDPFAHLRPFMGMGSEAQRGHVRGKGAQ
jgi:hypothetical protein